MKLTPKQAIVLSTFEEGEELTIRELAERSGRKVSSVETMVYGLLGKEYLVRGKDILKKGANKVTYTYRLKNNMDDAIANTETTEPHYNFVPYKQEQIAVDFDVPDEYKTTHVLPHERYGQHDGIYLENSKHQRKIRKNNIDVRRNNSSLNRI